MPSRSAAPYPFYRPEIEIIDTPDGEAPDWVRRAWVGVILPLAMDGPVDCGTTGVLTGPRSYLRQLLQAWFGSPPKVQNGYVVNAATAIDILADTAPDAAQWWREATPHLLDGTQTLFFESTACQRVNTPAPAPANR